MQCIILFQALKILRTADYSPLVVFVGVPTVAAFTEVKGHPLYSTRGVEGCRVFITKLYSVPDTIKTNTTDRDDMVDEVYCFRAGLLISLSLKQLT